MIVAEAEWHDRFTGSLRRLRAKDSGKQALVNDHTGLRAGV